MRCQRGVRRRALEVLKERGCEGFGFLAHPGLSRWARSGEGAIEAVAEHVGYRHQLRRLSVRIRFPIADIWQSVFNGLMDENPSERLIDQRVRNRIMEAVHTIADGEEGVRREWPGEYFESFYTWIPHHNDGDMQPNSAISPEERTGLLELSAILDEACDATPKIMSADEFIDTGWPKRMQPTAQKVLRLMLARGRFSEHREEAEASDVRQWP